MIYRFSAVYFFSDAQVDRRCLCVVTHNLSTDKSVAKVSKDGTVTGVSEGTCYVWVYARNGLGEKVKITVK